MKKVLSIILALVFALSMLSACGGGTTPASESTPAPESSAPESAAPAGKLAAVKAAGKLVVATDAAWAPFEYIGANGEPTGSDLELAQYIADALGVKLEVINVAFDSISTYLINDEADLSLSAMTITPERLETLDFSDPYTTAQQYMIILDTNPDTATIEDLAGKAIGVHLGTTGDFLVSDEVSTGVLADTGASVQQYKFLTDAALALKNGELGAIVCDTLLAENIVAVNGGMKCFPLAYATGEVELEQLGIAMKKGDAEFVAAINEIIAPAIADGTIDNWIVEHSAKASELS